MSAQDPAAMRSRREQWVDGQKQLIGFLRLLFLVFLVLKLTGYIAWSWWWVSAPLWAPPLAILAIIVAIGITALVASYIPKRGGSR